MRVRGRILAALWIGVVFGGPDLARAQDATSTNLPERIESGEATPQPATHKKTRRSRRAVTRASSEPPLGEPARTATTQEEAPRSMATQRARVKKRPASAVQRELSGAPVPAQLSLSAAQALAISAPLPEYPYEAKHANATGSGICVMIVDTASGKVNNATMAQSTGNAVLDKVTVETFRRWQFRPGSVTEIRVPISYE